MILTCPQCSTRLQLEKAKLPTRTFTVKCPKCQHSISVEPPDAATGEGVTGALTMTSPSPPTQSPSEERPLLADTRLPRIPTDVSASTVAMEHDPITALTRSHSSC